MHHPLISIAVLLLSQGQSPRSAPTPSFMGLGFRTGSTQSRAYAVSADGSVVAGSSSGGFRWTQGTGIQPIGAGDARDISADGSVIAGRYRIVACLGKGGMGLVFRAVREPGGRAYFPDKVEELEGVYQEIATELKSQYYLSYEPSGTNWDGRWRKIRLTAPKRNVEIRTRSGYYAVRRSS